MGNLCRDARYARIMRVPRPLYSPCGLFRVMNLRDRPRPVSTFPNPRSPHPAASCVPRVVPSTFLRITNPTISIRPVILPSRSALVPVNSGCVSIRETRNFRSKEIVVVVVVAVAELPFYSGARVARLDRSFVQLYLHRRKSKPRAVIF